MKQKAEILPNAVYTTEEAAELLDLSVLTIQKYIRNGLIEATTIGDKWYRISGQALLNFIEFYKKISVVLNSKQNEEKKWIPKAILYVNLGHSIIHHPLEWNKTFPTKEEADQFALLATKQQLSEGLAEKIKKEGEKIKTWEKQ